MNRLRLKSEYLPLIEEGRKRSTIRAGVPRIGSGRAELVSGDQVLPVLVTRTVVKRFEELGEEDARTDGFETLKELTEALRRFYPSLSGSDPVSIVYFEHNGPTT